jgi:ABC-type transporter Mla MlaB component
MALKAYAGAKAGWNAVSGVLGGGGGGGKGMPDADKVGDDIGKLTKGAGPGAGGVLQGLAGGLKAFGAGAGQILIGAGVLAGAIAILSAGIGAAAFILGNTLPFLAEGLKSFAEIDGANLTMVGLGVGALAIGIGSLALAQAGKGTVDFLGGIAQAFGAKGLSTQLQEFADLGPGLKEAGEGLKTFTNALLGLTTINTDKLNVLASTMSNLNKSLPKKSFLDMAGEALVNLTQPLVQSSQAATPQIAGTNNINLNELVGVNTQMLAVMKDVVKQQKDTISAIKKLNKANF